MGKIGKRRRKEIGCLASIMVEPSSTYDYATMTTRGYVTITYRTQDGALQRFSIALSISKSVPFGR